MLLDLSFTIEKLDIKKHKQEASHASTHKETSMRVKDEFKVNDQLFLEKVTLQGK